MGAAPWVKGCCARAAFPAGGPPCERWLAVGSSLATVGQTRQDDSVNDELYTLSVTTRSGRTPVEHFRRGSPPVMPGLRERETLPVRRIDGGGGNA